MQKVRKKIVFLVLFIIAAMTAGTAVFAYFNNVQRVDPVVFSSGNVKFVWQGSFLEHDLVVPSLELVDANDTFALKNQSSVPTELRLRIVGISSLLGDTSIDYLFDYIIDENWIAEGQYFYYRGPETDSTSEPGKYIIPVNQGSIIPVLSSLQVNGYNVRNEHSGETISLLIYFQAKQSQNVDWTTIGSLQFNFALPRSSEVSRGIMYD